MPQKGVSEHWGRGVKVRDKAFPYRRHCRQDSAASHTTRMSLCYHTETKTWEGTGEDSRQFSKDAMSLNPHKHQTQGGGGGDLGGGGGGLGARMVRVIRWRLNVPPGALGACVSRCTVQSTVMTLFKVVTGWLDLLHRTTSWPNWPPRAVEERRWRPIICPCSEG